MKFLMIDNINSKKWFKTYTSVDYVYCTIKMIKE